MSEHKTGGYTCDSGEMSADRTSAAKRSRDGFTRAPEWTPVYPLGA